MSIATNKTSQNNTAQANFNPSWMPNVKTSFRPERLSTSEDDKPCEPIFSRYSYGREDLLALSKTSASMRPPSGIEKCLFYSHTPKEPMLLLPFTEGELKLHNSINSSKALSSHGRNDKHPANGGYETHSGGTGMKPMYSKKFGENQTHSRWSALEPSNASWKANERSGWDKQAPLSSQANSDQVDNSNNKKRDIGQKNSPDRNNDNGGQTSKQLSAVDHEDTNNPEAKDSTKSMPQLQPCKWKYLDPNGIQRGPFDGQQMQAWYSSGYFNNGLKLCRAGDSTFITLGELVTQNGSATPFVDKTPVTPTQPQDTMRPSVTTAELLRENHISPNLMDVEKIWSNPSADDSALREKERQILEEQRKLREKEELLRREESEREEKARKMKELEDLLNRQKEELDRIAREKERELEMRCLQVAEYERKRREELDMLEQRLKNHQIQEQMKREEEERRRAKELEETLRKEQERQRLALEAEAKRIRQEEEARLRQIAFEEAQRIAALAEARREAERKKAESRPPIVAPSQVQQQPFEAFRPVPRPSANPPISVTRSEKKGTAWNINDSQQNISFPIGVDWTPMLSEPNGPSTNAPAKTPIQQPPKRWNQVPAPTPAPIPVSPAKVLPKAPPPVQKNSSSGTNKKLQPEKQRSDQFTIWVVKRVHEMNSDVDAEIFANFIEGIESPNEVEDYILGYLGDSKAVRDFHREFLTKRIELRPRAKISPKDDLSKPAAAVTDNNKTQNCQNNNGANAKKCKKPPQKVLDPRTLGFRPSGDPNRINAGEIDVTPPVTNGKKKR